MSSARQRTAAGAPRSRLFRRLQGRAAGYVGDGQKLRDLVDRALKKSQAEDTGELGAAVEDLKSLGRLARAYARGEYRAVRTDSIILVAAALLYFVSPVDVIPDFVPGGLLDDAAVLGFVVRRLRSEVDQYLAWERARGKVIDVEGWEQSPSG